jgi:hypothetical protein
VSFPSNRILSVQINCATDNVPTSFSTAAGSKILTGLANAGRLSLYILNETAQIISGVNTDDDSGTPAQSSNQRFYIPSFGFVILDNCKLYNNLFIQSEGTGTSSRSTISSGKVFACAFGSV